MGFFKDLKQDSNKTNEKTAKDEVLEITTTEGNLDSGEQDTDDVLDEDMYKDILAAAEQMLTDESEDDSSQDDESSQEQENPQEEISKEESSQKEITPEGSTHKETSQGKAEIQHNTESKQETLKKEQEVKKAQETKKEQNSKNKMAKNEKDEKVENTMVDYDENAVDSEILDTLLKDEEKEEKEEKAEAAPAEKPHETAPDLTKEDKEAVTVITKGTTINGSITSDCSLDVMGTINGDIECLGKLSISGKVIGNSMASEVYVNTERLEGSISSEGSVKIGVGTVVIGDITATSGVIAGAVKGEVDVTGPVVIDSTAIIKGNVKAKSVQMNNGAVLEGFCSLSYSDVDIDNIFE